MIHTESGLAGAQATGQRCGKGNNLRLSSAGTDNRWSFRAMSKSMVTPPVD